MLSGEREGEKIVSFVIRPSFVRGQFGRKREERPFIAEQMGITLVRERGSVCMIEFLFRSPFVYAQMQVIEALNQGEEFMQLSNANDRNHCRLWEQSYNFQLQSHKNSGVFNRA